MAFNEMRAIKGSAWMLSGLAWASGKLSIGPWAAAFPQDLKGWVITACVCESSTTLQYRTFVCLEMAPFEILLN